MKLVYVRGVVNQEMKIYNTYEELKLAYLPSKYGCEYGFIIPMRNWNWETDTEAFLTFEIYNTYEELKLR